MDHPAEPGAQAPVDLSQALDRLWVRFLPEIEARIAVLDSAASALAQNALTASEREEAHAAAHKLAGVLGTFGLTRGTELARELEIAFSLEPSPGPAPAATLTQAVTELRTLIASRRPRVSPSVSS